MQGGRGHWNGNYIGNLVPKVILACHFIGYPPKKPWLLLENVQSIERSILFIINGIEQESIVHCLIPSDL